MLLSKEDRRALIEDCKTLSNQELCQKYKCTNSSLVDEMKKLGIYDKYERSAIGHMRASSGLNVFAKKKGPKGEHKRPPLSVKPRDIVVAVNPKAENLSLNKPYQVLRVGNGGMILVRGDNGIVKPYSRRNFAL